MLIKNVSYCLHHLIEEKSDDYECRICKATKHTIQIRIP